MKPRLYEKYLNEVRPVLMEKRRYKNVHQVPELEKIVINMGVSDSLERGAVRVRPVLAPQGEARCVFLDECAGARGLGRADLALEMAAEKNAIIPLADLCATFPSNQADAFLAYAEAESFTRFIVDNHGTTGLSALVSAYADGMDCEQGAARALNEPLSRLEIRWRETELGENRAGVIASNIFPYLLLLALALMVPAWSVLERLRERRKNARSE